MHTHTTHRSARPARHRRRGNGNAIIEMALLFPVLMYLGLGMVEFGQFFYVKGAFQQAARDAGRAALMHNAARTDPDTAARRTLAAAGITYQPTWLTIVDITPGSWGGSLGAGVVSDCSAVPTGHGMTVTLTTTYDALPGATRPLFQMTGQGIKSGRAVTGSCFIMKE